MRLPPPHDQVHLEDDVENIAAATLKNGGAAFKLGTRQFLAPMDVWEFPKYPGRTVILPPQVDLVQELRKFISANEQFLGESDCWLGTWINPVTHEFYLDITTGCEDLDDATNMAREVSKRDGRRIVAIYNSKQKRTIYL